LALMRRFTEGVCPRDKPENNSPTSTIEAVRRFISNTPC